MQRLTSQDGTVVSYEKSGSGPPLVLVHGTFSDHQTNWEFVNPAFSGAVHRLRNRATGRGETDATVGHSLEDEGRDIVALRQALTSPRSLQP